MLRVSRAEMDPRLIARFKVFRRSLTVNSFIKFLIQGLQGSKGQRVQHMKGYILSLSPGHKGGSRVNISKTYRVSRAECFKGTKRSKGFRDSRDRGSIS